MSDNQALVVKQTLKAMTTEINTALPPHINADRFVRNAYTAITNNPYLLGLDRPSLFNAVMKSAQDGLMPDGKEAALDDKTALSLIVHIPSPTSFKVTEQSILLCFSLLFEFKNFHTLITAPDIVPCQKIGPQESAINKTKKSHGIVGFHVPEAGLMGIGAVVPCRRQRCEAVDDGTKGLSGDNGRKQHLP